MPRQIIDITPDTNGQNGAYCTYGRHANQARREAEHRIRQDRRRRDNPEQAAAEDRRRKIDKEIIRLVKNPYVPDHIRRQLFRLCSSWAEDRQEWDRRADQTEAYLAEVDALADRRMREQLKRKHSDWERDIEYYFRDYRENRKYRNNLLFEFSWKLILNQCNRFIRVGLIEPDVRDRLTERKAEAERAYRLERERQEREWEEEKARVEAERMQELRRLAATFERFLLTYGTGRNNWSWMHLRCADTLFKHGLITEPMRDYANRLTNSWMDRPVDDIPESWYDFLNRVRDEYDMRDTRHWHRDRAWRMHLADIREDRHWRCNPHRRTSKTVEYWRNNPRRRNHDNDRRRSWRRHHRRMRRLLDEPHA